MEELQLHLHGAHKADREKPRRNIHSRLEKHITIVL